MIEACIQIVIINIITPTKTSKKNKGPKNPDTIFVGSPVNVRPDKAFSQNISTMKKMIDGIKDKRIKIPKNTFQFSPYSLKDWDIISPSPITSLAILNLKICYF